MQCVQVFLAKMADLKSHKDCWHTGLQVMQEIALCTATILPVDWTGRKGDWNLTKIWFKSTSRWRKKAARDVGTPRHVKSILSWVFAFYCLFVVFCSIWEGIAATIPFHRASLPLYMITLFSEHLLCQLRTVAAEVKEGNLVGGKISGF